MPDRGPAPPRARYADGSVRRSDATFWRDGTWAEPSYWRISENPRWPLLAGWKKALAIVATTTGAVLIALQLWFHFAGTERVLAVACGLLLGTQLVRAVLGWERHRHYRDVVQPLAIAAAPIVDHPPTIRAKVWLEIPQNYATEETAVSVIHVPGDFNPDDRDLDDLKRAYTAKTGIQAPEVKLMLKGRDPRLEVRRALPPPLKVGLPDIRAAIDKAKPLQVVVGLDREGKPVIIDFDSETPHGAFTGTTGAGKSECAKNVAAQWLYHGGIVIILDYKLVSHMWADGLPNVCYARTADEIHDVMMWLAFDEYDADGRVVKASELTRRKEVVLAARRRGERNPNPGPSLLIIAEERNATGRVLKRHWRRTGNRGSAPALEALDETGETGRQIDVHVWHIAQRLSAKASSADGTADARENIGAIVTKDPKESTWAMLADGYAQPPRSGHPGRYQLIVSSGVTEFQGVLYDKEPQKSDDIARELAMSGTIGVPRFDMPLVNVVPTGLAPLVSARQEVPEQGVVVGSADPVLPVGDGGRRAVTLAELVAAGLVVSIGAARKLPARHGWEPVGGDRVRGYQYALTDVYKSLNWRRK